MDLSISEFALLLLLNENDDDRDEEPEDELEQEQEHEEHEEHEEDAVWMAPENDLLWLLFMFKELPENSSVFSFSMKVVWTFHLL